MNSFVRIRGANCKQFHFLQSVNKHTRQNYRSTSMLAQNTLRNYNNKTSSSATTTTTVGPCRIRLSNRYLSVIGSNVNDIDELCRYHNYYSYHAMRQLHTTHPRYETTSKVDATVKGLKDKQKEKVDEIIKEVVSGSITSTSSTGVGTNNVLNASASTDKSSAKSATASTAKPTTSATAAPVKAPDAEKAVVVKKPFKQRVWDELVHYYHGFRLLFIDISISARLLWRILHGKTLTRRENKLLLRTTSDLFRLIPFSVFIVVPFLELLLPLFIKVFPGMLPSTFQTAKEREARLRQSLQVRLEMAKFLQKTLDEMPVQHKDHKSEEAKQFELFFHRIKDPTEFVSNDEIIKYAKRFDDEITLDSLSREQLAALCRVLELNTIGTTTMLRFQLRMKLRSLSADDRVIAREGVDSLDLVELQQACKSRGMRAYGLTAERLRFQLREWIDLSLNEKVPPTLLLLSRAMNISDDTITTDKLKETMRVLPDAVAAQTREAIGEREGKIDNKTKIEIIKEEERKIKEEQEEEREEIKAKREILQDKAPVIETASIDLPHTCPSKAFEETAKKKDTDQGISSTDVQLLSEALKTISSEKQHVVEKEAIKELKEELQDYKDDVEELREVRNVVKEPVRESRAAKMLYNRVNKMIGQLDKVLTDLEVQQKAIKQTNSQFIVKGETGEFIQIDELVQSIKKMKEASDENRMKTIQDMLSKFDLDKDGAVTNEELMKVVKSIDSSNSQIDKKQLDEFVNILTTEVKKTKQKELVRIDDLMQNVKKLKETSDEVRLKHIENTLSKFDVDKDGAVTINDIRRVVESLGRENIKLDDKQIEELIMLLDKEQILQAEEKIEKAIAKSIKEAEKLKAEMNKNEQATVRLVDDIQDTAQEIRDLAKELGRGESEMKPDIAKDLSANDAKEQLKDKAKDLSSRDNAKDLNPCDFDCLRTPTEPTIRTTSSDGTNKNDAKARDTKPKPKAEAATSTGDKLEQNHKIDQILPSGTATTSIPPTIPSSQPSSTKPTATASAATTMSSSKKIL